MELLEEEMDLKEEVVNMEVAVSWNCQSAGILTLTVVHMITVCVTECAAMWVYVSFFFLLPSHE